jgi:hypothetical protein
MRVPISIVGFLILALASTNCGGKTVDGYLLELSSSCRALPDLTVTLTPPRNSQSDQLVTKTDDQGKFSFEYPGSGSVYLEVFQGTVQLYGHVIDLDTAQFPLSIGLAPAKGSPALCGKKPDAFNPGCDTPRFPSFLRRPIDEVCGLSGTGTSALLTQNAAKNNFCASGTPNEVTVAEMVKLQDRADADSGIGTRKYTAHKSGELSPPIDRTPLKEMGEGQPVVLRGFVLIARQEGAESVNCGRDVPIADPHYHDIHIAVVASGDQSDECKSIVVEMSSHHRPPEWTASNINKLAASKTPVRVTGQLFFDSSHRPCIDGQRNGHSAKRASEWEIHPVYNFQVCIRDCDRDGQWVPLEAWRPEP